MDIHEPWSFCIQISSSYLPTCCMWHLISLACKKATLTMWPILFQFDLRNASTRESVIHDAIQIVNIADQVQNDPGSCCIPLKCPSIVLLRSVWYSYLSLWYWMVILRHETTGAASWTKLAWHNSCWPINFEVERVTWQKSIIFISCGTLELRHIAWLRCEPIIFNTESGNSTAVESWCAKSLS